MESRELVYDDGVKRRKPITYTVNDRGCWECISHAPDKDGYTKIKVGGKDNRLHRRSYEQHHGAIPLGYVILHACDNPKCFNPNHLSAGTVLENMRDKTRKGRGNSTKLTREQALVIIKKEISAKDAVREFGISRHHYYKIRNGEYWKELINDNRNEEESGEVVQSTRGNRRTGDNPAPR